jgi:hypothetical protein
MNARKRRARDVGKEKKKKIEIIELKTPTYKQSSEARDLRGLSNTATPTPTPTSHADSTSLRRLLK